MFEEFWTDPRIPREMKRCGKPPVRKALSKFKGDKAMKEKLFDQLGALPAFAKADPIVVGQVLHWHPSRPPVTFFVSWWLDTADL